MKLSETVNVDFNVHSAGLRTGAQILYDQDKVTLTGTNSELEKGVAASSSLVILLVIKQIRNPSFIGTSSTSMSILTMTSESKVIDRISSSFQATANEATQLTITSLSALSRTVNTLTTFEFELQPTVVFLQGGKLQIILPSELTVSGSSVCTILIGLASENQKTGSCGYKGAQLFETQDYYYPNTATFIKVQITLILTPPSTRTTSSFQFVTYNQQSQILCQHSPFDQTFTATPAVLTFSTAPKRSLNTANSAMTLSFQISLTNQVPKGGFVHITLDTNYFASLQNAYQCAYLDSNGLQQQITPCSLTAGTSSLLLTFEEYCSGLLQYCVAGTKLSLLITLVTNPEYVPDASSASELVVSTYTPTSSGQSSLIDQGSTSITPPSEPYSFASLAFSRSSNTAGQDTQLSVALSAVKYSLLTANNGDLHITFPRDLFCLQHSIVTPTCAMKAGDVSSPVAKCKVSLHSQTTDQATDSPCSSIQHIILDDMCDTNKCAISTNSQGVFSVEVTGLRNYMALTASSGTDSLSVTLKDTTSLKSLQKSSVASNLRSTLTIGALSSLAITSTFLETNK